MQEEDCWMNTYGILATCLGVLLVLLITILFIRRRSDSLTKGLSHDILSSSKSDVSVNDEKAISEVVETVPAISFEPLPALTDEESCNLVEIKDQQLLSRIDGIIPGAVRLAANAGSVHAYNQAMQSAGQLYQAIIPKGAALANSKGMEGAVRGFFRDAQNIRGQANFVAVDGNIGKGLAAMNIANAAMGVASMIVGQYYMSQINNRLDSMAHTMEKIAGFQENEYSGKIINLMIEVQKESSFQLESMESDELRNRKLVHLQALEHECGQLLEQANSTLQSFNRKRVKDYEEYKKMISEASFWYQSQQALLHLLSEIGELIFVMNLGAISRESSFAVLNAHYEQSQIALQRLNAWHRTNISRFEIDVDGSRRKRQGFDSFIMTVPAVFDGNLRYRQISNRVIANIQEQMQGSLPFSDRKKDLFQEDVRLVCKDSKLFYLPSQTIS